MAIWRDWASLNIKEWCDRLRPTKNEYKKMLHSKKDRKKENITKRKQERTIKGQSLRTSFSIVEKQVAMYTVMSWKKYTS